jgi:hypothetical protein
MLRFAPLLAFLVLAGVTGDCLAQDEHHPKVNLTDAQARAVEAAAPERAPAAPARPRKLLVYGRVPTHPESVPACFQAIEILGRKTGAFQAVSSGDPAMFLPERLAQFDAVVMNNTHEPNPLLPFDFKKLPKDQQAAAKEREKALKKSFLDFVANGKGLVGIHGATCSVQWPEYMELLGGTYAGHITETVWIKPEEPDHPLCRPLEGKSFQVQDEIYFFRSPPYSRDKQRILLSLDLGKTPDPGSRPDRDYAVSWVRQYGKGRVFYCSLGHMASVYRNPILLRHYLAGIQLAIGDLPAEASPRK